MAKKVTKKATKTIENVETLDVPVVAVEEKLQNELLENVTKELSELSEKMEEVQPTEEFIQAVMSAEPQDAQELIKTETEKIENLEKVIQNKIDDIVNNNPEVVSVMKKMSNRSFTNFWNGVEY